MDYSALLIAQVTDIFRIGLLVGLIYTIERTRQQTGVLIPMVAGIVFVAVILATTMPAAGVPVTQSIATGIAANAAITGVLWLIWSLIRKRAR